MVSSKAVGEGGTFIVYLYEEYVIWQLWQMLADFMQDFLSGRSKTVKDLSSLFKE